MFQLNIFLKANASPNNSTKYLKKCIIVLIFFYFKVLLSFIVNQRPDEGRQIPQSTVFQVHEFFLEAVVQFSCSQSSQ
jgi:hypothetical protein